MRKLAHRWFICQTVGLIPKFDVETEEFNQSQTQNPHYYGGDDEAYSTVRTLMNFQE